MCGVGGGGGGEDPQTSCEYVNNCIVRLHDYRGYLLTRIAM